MISEMIGEIVHVELPSRDFARSAGFYAKLFGWKTDGVQSGGHLRFEPPQGIPGSWIRDALAHAPGPVPFVAVADVDKTLAEAEKQGGRILVQRLSLPGRGTFGMLADCVGNVIGVLSAAAGKTEKTPVRTESVDVQAKPTGKSTAKLVASPAASAKPPAAKKSSARKR